MAKVAIVALPERGDYIRSPDGGRMGLVLAIDPRGGFEVEDAVTEEMERIPAQEIGAWVVIQKAALSG